MGPASNRQANINALVPCSARVIYSCLCTRRMLQHLMHFIKLSNGIRRPRAGAGQ